MPAHPAKNIADFVLSHGADDAAAIIWRNQTYTHGQFRAVVNAMADGLLAANLTPGDRVAILADNGLFAIGAYFAAMKVGGVAVPLAPATALKNLSFQVASTEAQFAFVQWKYLKKWQQVAPHARVPLWLDKIQPNFSTGESTTVFDLDACLDPDGSSLREHASREAPDDLAAIMFTSGSTGQPRGVRVTHANLLANTQSIVQSLGLTPTDRAMLVLPLYYCFGASVVHTHLSIGGAIVISDGFMFAEKVLDQMDQTRCTCLYGVPSTFQLLLRRTKFAQRSFPNVRFFAQAGGRLPTPFIREIRTAFPQIDLFVMYGQTEATARLSCLPPDRLQDKMGSIGCGIPGVTLTVVTPAGVKAKPGETGEVVARGANITQGYWQDQDATALRFRDGMLWTGDLATVDEEGFIFIRDRARDFLKVAGVRISAKEVEDTIAELDQVVEVAVIGTPDELLGEAIVAYVVPLNGSELDEQTVQRCCSQRLSNEKVPKHVVLTERLPKNEAGKVIKPRLREMFTLDQQSYGD